MSIPLIAKTFKEPRVVADTKMPIAISPAAPVAPVFAIFSTLVSVVPTISISIIPIAPVYVISTAPILTGLGVFLFLISFFTSLLQVHTS